MQAKISKWGNSLALRLPSGVANAAKLSEGSAVDILIENGSVVIRPVRKRFRLSELLDGYPVGYAENADETHCGKPVGAEAL